MEMITPVAACLEDVVVSSAMSRERGDYLMREPFIITADTTLFQR